MQWLIVLSDFNRHRDSELFCFLDSCSDRAWLYLTFKYL